MMHSGTVLVASSSHYQSSSHCYFFSHCHPFSHHHFQVIIDPVHTILAVSSASDQMSSATHSFTLYPIPDLGPHCVFVSHLLLACWYIRLNWSELTGRNNPSSIEPVFRGFSHMLHDRTVAQ